MSRDETPPAGPKSVDWLDALREQGAEAVRRELADAARQAIDHEEHERRERMRGAAMQSDRGIQEAPASVGEAGNAAPESTASAWFWGNPDYYPKSSTNAAILFLSECFAPLRPDRPGGACWRFLSWNGLIYIWQEGRWKNYKYEVVRSIARDWASRKLKRHKDADGEWAVSAYEPTDRSISELLKAAQDLTCIAADEMGGWLSPSHRDGDAIPRHDRPADRRVLTQQERAAEGLPDPKRLLGLTNGILKIDALVEGRVELMESTERLFIADPLPHPWPASATEAVQAGRMDSWYAEHCPAWLRHLEWIASGRTNFSNLIVRHAGRAMVSLLESAQIPILVGGGGAGKGTIIEVLALVFGPSAADAMTTDAIGDPSQLDVLIGKRIALFPDDEVSTDSNKLGIAKGLCKMSEGASLLARVLYTGAVPFKNTAMPMIACNSLPNLRDPGGALASRLSIFEFRHALRGTAAEDPLVKERILAEAPAIMVHIIWEGLRGYLADKAAGIKPLPRPDGHNEALGIFSAQANLVGTFVEDCFEACQSVHVPGVPEGEHPSIYTGTMFALFQAWCDLHGKTDQRMNISLFGTRVHAPMLKLGCSKRDDKVLRDDAGNKLGRRSHWMGLRLREGVIAELYKGPLDEKLPKYGVLPAEDLDYPAHRSLLDKMGEAMPGSRTLPLAVSPPTEGVTDA